MEVFPLPDLSDSDVDYKQLGQARENSTNAVSVYSPGAGETAIIPSKGVCVINQSGAAATLRLFLDDDGTTYDETTALIWDMSCPPGLPVHYDGVITMNDATGNLAYRSSVANALTITVFGAVKT